MKFIDVHTHIDFYDNPQDILFNYNEESILTIFMTYLPEIFEKHRMELETTPNVRIALGYHPSMILNYEFKKDIFLNNLDFTNYIGEIGLDYNISRDEKIHEKQRSIFDFITKQTNYNKILSIHSKKAEKDVLNILIKNKVKHAIFHWYNGSLTLIDDIIDEGYYFSINYQMLISQKGQKIIKRIPIDRILFETDGPFIKYNSSPIKPNNIKLIYNEMNTFFDINNIDEILYNNFKQLLQNRQNYEKDCITKTWN